jgi:ADP-ribose pyrophosphatase YjhB (NUDIX family)
MFVSKDTIASWAIRYGTPQTWSHRQDVTAVDYGIISGSQKHGRHHDITLYIEREGQIAVIAKPFYPPGLYRAPSGGLEPGESLEAGAAREAVEETGLHIELSRYLLATTVIFECSEKPPIEWHTHVFAATTADRVLAPTDHHEIREARWAQPTEFRTFSEIMRHSQRGGLLYRAALHEQVARIHPAFGQMSS